MQLILLILIFCFSMAQAGTVILSSRTETFKNNQQDCVRNQTCSLKEFTLIELKKKTTLSQSKYPSYSTDVRFIVKTTQKSEVEEYGIVQYIRGCQYHSSKSGLTMDVSRHYMTGMINFQHTDWSIDSDNSDPVYTSWRGKRHALYRSNLNPNSYDPETAKFYNDITLPHPVVFATDLPGSFSFDGKVAKNSSLEFEVCLFKMQDLPSASTPDGAGIDKRDAIKCFNWESKFTYRFSSNDFKIGGDLEPFCMEGRP